MYSTVHCIQCTSNTVYVYTLCSLYSHLEDCSHWKLECFYAVSLGNRCDWLIINSNPAYDLWTLKQRGCFMSDDKIWIELILRRIIHDDIADHASTNDILINAFQYYREKNWPLLYYGICCNNNCFEYDSSVSWNRNWIGLPKIRIRADSSVAVGIFSYIFVLLVLSKIGIAKTTF